MIFNGTHLELGVILTGLLQALGGLSEMVMIAPMPKDGVNAIDEDSFVVSVNDIVTPLITVKKNLLLAGLFPGCDEDCRMCSVLPTGCHLLKSGVQRLMNNKEIMFEKTLVPLVPTEEVAIITIFDNYSKDPSRKPVRITSVPRIAPVIITVPGAIPYTSDKAVPLH